MRHDPGKQEHRNLQLINTRTVGNIELKLNWEVLRNLIQSLFHFQNNIIK
jgi:hypothetical protein